MMRSVGFTLIEILVVLFIISIVTTVALLSVRWNENKQIEAFANEVTQTLSLVVEQAMLQPAVLGVILNGETLRFVRLEPPHGTHKKASWVPLDDRLFQPISVPEQAFIKGPVNKIIFSTNGDFTPFKLLIGKKDRGPQYVIVGEENGEIRLQSL